ncbi:hypothetical protein NicSoilB8_29230 [Arthrobacter sp. NicSoilB8]|nr:hypothetical protein NicSoilB8_29230 [Arthrobacter sp. NicSoilB8]
MIGATTTASRNDQAEKRATFEKVLNMSSAELESKTVTELNGYQADIVKAGHHNMGLGNITGYDKTVVDHELKQVNDLILKKIDR